MKFWVPSFPMNTSAVSDTCPLFTSYDGQLSRNAQADRSSLVLPPCTSANATARIAMNTLHELI